MFLRKDSATHGPTGVTTASRALSIANSTGGLTLSAPADASYFTLYATTNLAPPIAWTPLTNAPVLTNNEWRLTLSAAKNGQRFFRLRTQ